MRIQWFIFVLISLATGISGALGADHVPPSGSFQWPLDLGTRYLTSNFMEFRDGRFHAGLDLKTETRQGYTVRAVEDGYISRLRCTATAYGKVVYLRGDSGRTFVFAHLSRFNDELQARVQGAQNKNGSYRIGLEFGPGRIPVKKGDVLGLSGQSGTGGPHLHFEVRDGNQRPINPLDQGFAVQDTIAPVVHLVRAWPVRSGVRINGELEQWVIKGDTAQGLSGDLGLLQATGPVAFSARMIDASDIRGHKLEPWLIELEQDGQIVYRCQNERYAFHENSMQRLEWTNWADWTSEGGPREHWLHRRAANTLDGREGDLWYLGPNGTGLNPGEHHFKLRVVDYSGGQSSVSWVLRVVSGGEKPDQTGAWCPESLGVTSSNFPELKTPLAKSLRLTPFFSVGDPESLGLKVRHFSPSEGDPVLEPLEIWIKNIKPNAEHLSSTSFQGLTYGGWAAGVFAVDWPIEGSIPVDLDLDLPAATPSSSTLTKASNTQQSGLYRLKKSGNWDFVTPISLSKSTLFLFEEPGVHAVFIDKMPPVFQSPESVLLVNLGPESLVEGVTLPEWGITAVSLEDLGSGIQLGSLKALLNGITIIVEPDPPRDRVLINWPDEMAAGVHQLQMTVSDKAGNNASVIFEVLAEP